MGYKFPKEKVSQVSQGWSNDQAVHDVINGLVMEFLDMLGDGEAGPTIGVRDSNQCFFEHIALFTFQNLMNLHGTGTDEKTSVSAPSSPHFSTWVSPRSKLKWHLRLLRSFGTISTYVGPDPLPHLESRRNQRRDIRMSPPSKFDW